MLHDTAYAGAAVDILPFCLLYVCQFKRYAVQVALQVMLVPRPGFAWVHAPVGDRCCGLPRLTIRPAS